jgi:hypothetical protein
MLHKNPFSVIKIPMEIRQEKGGFAIAIVPIADTIIILRIARALRDKHHALDCAP